MIEIVKNIRGFTLAELLIAVAIIAVIVAISIPIFTSQLEKSREATDAANIRAQYTEVMAEAITTGKDVNVKSNVKTSNDSRQFDVIKLKQKQSGWQNKSVEVSLSNLGEIDGEPQNGGTAWVDYKGEKLTIHYGVGLSNTQKTSAVIINEKLSAVGIMDTYSNRTKDNDWTGPKAAVSAVGFKNSESDDPNQMFPTTLKKYLGETFSYEIKKGDNVRYIYITTDGIYQNNSKGISNLSVVRYTYDFSSGHTSEKTTSLLNIEYGTADINGKGFENFKVKDTGD